MKKQNKVLSVSGVLTMIFILILSGISGCVENPSSGKIGVLVTIIPQEEMVESIGGEFITITSLVPQGQSPHLYEPTPSQLIKISNAAAYFIVGSGVEFERVHLKTIIEQNPDLHVFNSSKKINIISYDDHYKSLNQDDDKEQDEEHHHTGNDPHIWTSPENYILMAESVYNGLIEIDPEHQDYYTENFEKYLTVLTNLHANISLMLKPYEYRSFMVYHPSWGYFGDTYRLQQIAIEDDGKQPGPATIAAIIEQAINQSIHTIFVTPQFDTASAQTIADEINGTVVYADPLMSNYQETLLFLASEIVKGFDR